MNSDIAKGLVKLSQNRETMIKIFDLALKGDPNDELFITIGVRNRKKMVKKTMTTDTPFGRIEETKDIPFEMEVRERADASILLNLAKAWLTDVNQRILDLSNQFNKENEQLSNEVTRRTETKST